MKKAKRTLALLLALLMCLALCACGGKSEAAPAKTEAPAAAEPGVGKYIMQYWEVSPEYLEEEYGLEAKEGVGTRSLAPEDMEGCYVELNGDGTGYLYLGENNQGKIDTWKLDGEKLSFKAGISDFDGTIKNGLMRVEVDDGLNLYFAAEGAKVPAVEMIPFEEYLTLLFGGGEKAETEVKEPEDKEPEVKEPEIKEPEIKEPEVKEPEAGDHDKVPSDSKKKDGKSSKKTEEVTVKEGVLFEGGGLRVTATGKCVDDPAHGLKIAILVENDTDIEYLIGCDPAFINGCAAKAYVQEKSIDEAWLTTVEAHSTLDCYICTELKDVKPLGIDNVARLDCEFKFINADDWLDEQVNSGTVTITTSLADNYTEPAAPQGKELYNAEGVRIVWLDQTPENDDSGMTVLSLLYVEDNSPMSADLVSITTYVNDEKLTGLASVKLLPGTRGVMPFYVMDSSLEDAGIKKADSLECEFWVQFKKDSGDMDHLTKTGLIAIPVA